MCAQETDWQMACDRETFEKCRKDEKFAYIVALARVVNALTFIRSMRSSVNDNSPAAMRDRINSYLFGSAIMYEALKLIKDMGRIFSTDDIYQNGLRLILKNENASAVEHPHLKPARHGAVFHFDASTFKETIDKGLSNECLFVSGRGTTRMGVSYSYADIVSAEILVGFPAGGEEFERVLIYATKATDALVTKFVDDAEPLIAHHLKRWGFVGMNQPVPDLPASPDVQP